MADKTNKTEERELTDIIKMLNQTLNVQVKIENDNNACIGDEISLNEFIGRGNNNMLYTYY